MVSVLLSLRLPLDAPGKNENALEKLQTCIKYFICPAAGLANAMIQD